MYSVEDVVVDIECGDDEYLVRVVVFWWQLVGGVDVVYDWYVDVYYDYVGLELV